MECRRGPSPAASCGITCAGSQAAYNEFMDFMMNV
jgi:hypothetical protein